MIKRLMSTYVPRLHIRARQGHPAYAGFDKFPVSKRCVAVLVQRCVAFFILGFCCVFEAMRSIPTFIATFVQVPDDKCAWTVEWKDYQPTEFTHPRILEQPRMSYAVLVFNFF